MVDRFQRLSLVLGLSVTALGATGCGLSGTQPQHTSRPPDGYAGQVRVSCALMHNGELSDCRIIDEEPEGAGFGEAALAAIRRSRVSPDRVNLRAGGARVEFTTRFRPEDTIETSSPAVPTPPR